MPRNFTILHKIKKMASHALVFQPMHKIAIATTLMAFLPVNSYIIFPKISISMSTTLLPKPPGSALASARFASTLCRMATAKARQSRSFLCSASVHETNEYGFPTFVSGPLYDGPPGCFPALNPMTVSLPPPRKARPKPIVTQEDASFAVCQTPVPLLYKT